MLRRSFLKSLTALISGYSWPPAAKIGSGRETWKSLQISSIAGFQYHQGERLWSQLAAGQALTLVREADNRFDTRAVRVEWRGQKLGYIPRLDNAVTAQLLNRREKLFAVIIKLQTSHNPWDRVTLEVKWMI